VRNSDPNIINHFWISEELKQKRYWDVSQINHIISGHLMGFSRKTWEEVGGFSEISNEILKVDNRFSKKILNAGKKILIMEGLYAFHYYRLHQPNPRKAKKHLL
jgi:GT2 family glycosyltransferase